MGSIKLSSLNYDVFNEEEQQYLATHFRVTTNISPDRDSSISAVDLLDEESLRAYLERIADKFQAPSLMVTASQFAKRYSFLIIAPSLYALSVYNKGVDHSLENCHLESAQQKGTWLPQLRLSDWGVSQPSENSRAAWRDQILENMFAGNLAKVWRALARTAKISSQVLWENTAVYVYWLYEKRIGEEANGLQKSRLQDDFQYLLNAPASLFGEAENPLKQFNGPKCVLSPAKPPIRVRQTCCFYYQISPQQSYCSTCPRNK